MSYGSYEIGIRVGMMIQMLADCEDEVSKLLGYPCPVSASLLMIEEVIRFASNTANREKLAALAAEIQLDESTLKLLEVLSNGKERHRSITENQQACS